MDSKNFKGLFLITLVIAIVLLLVLSYFLFFQPKLQGYVVNKQLEAQQMVVQNILLQIQQNGYVQIPVGNQTIVLVPYNQNQQVPQQTVAGK